MDKCFAIFDMDGTLVDSMPYWNGIGADYLRKKGVTEDLTELLERTKPMTMPETAAFFLDYFHLPDTPAAAAAEINAMMEAHYRSDIPAKPGVGAYLAELRRRGVAMCVASATGEALMRACLRRLGLEEYFAFVLSCETVGAGKDSPAVYLAAAERLGAAPGETAVYEDALNALRTAKQAGFYTVAVFDQSGAAQWEESKALAEEALRDWRETEAAGE